MIICIIAGGEGTRLWPLSQPSRPKHLLSLIDDKSLLQNTYWRAQQLTDKIFVVPEASHAEEVARQLPELPADHMFVEPARRGTASCIVMALARFKQMGLTQESIVFLAADHHIADHESFFSSISAAATASEIERRITLIGVEPTYPATGFGYMELASRLRDRLYEVASFHEKPSAETAQAYIKSGKYLWNVSLFAAPLHVFLESMDLNAPELKAYYNKLEKVSDEQTRRQIYLEFENKPIEYALIEKDPHTLAVAGNFGWADLGSFGDLFDVMKGEASNVQKGNLIEMLDCTNSMVLGHTDRPVIAIGLKDVVIVDSPDGLLVVEASQAQRVKEALKKIR
jgi:mannose-1-phosphate guanylyltransferase